MLHLLLFSPYLRPEILNMNIKFGAKFKNLGLHFLAAVFDFEPIQLAALSLELIQTSRCVNTKIFLS